MADDFLTEFIAAGGPDIGHLTGVFQFIVNQDLTPLSEPERATFLERAHRALGLPPESGTIVPMKGQFKIRGEVVEALRPYVNLEGLNKLAVRYGASTRLLSTEYGSEGAVVRMRAEIPGGRFRERETLCTNDEAAEEGRPAIDIASERAERQVLYGLLGLPEPTLGRGGLRFPRESSTRVLGPSVELVGSARPSEAPVADPGSAIVPAIGQTSAGPNAGPDVPVDPELASLEAMGGSGFDCAGPGGSAAVDAPDPLPSRLRVPDRQRQRQPWPYGKGRVTSPADMEPPRAQVDAYMQLLRDRGVTGGEAASRFTGRLMTGEDVPLNPYLLPVRDLRRCMEEVRGLASPAEMQAFDGALADRGYLDGAELQDKLRSLVGVRQPRDRDFLSSREIAGAIRVLSDEPTLAQVAECRILLEHLGLREAKLQEIQVMGMVGRSDPVPLRSLSAKELDHCINGMGPAVKTMKTKTLFPTNRQRKFPWSPEL